MTTLDLAGHSTRRLEINAAKGLWHSGSALHFSSRNVEALFATGETVMNDNPAAETPMVLIDVREVANVLGCSSRHVYRLTDLGAMPRPIKLGALVRWRRAEIEDWIAKGCPHVRGRPSQTSA